MNGQAVTDFFNERKEAWLKKNITSSMDDSVIKEKTAECDHLFSLEQWLPNAAKRAGQISISTHPCTFSHPSSRKNKNGYATSIIANNEARNDGFLRSGNVKVQADALGNAAALDVYKFLTLVMDDEQTLISHLKLDSDFAKSLFSIQTKSYEELKEGFLAMMQSESEGVTSSKIKQVYFPIDDDYHQLSLLTASGIVFDLRKRLDHLRFGDDEIKEIRKRRRNREYSETGYKEVIGLTTIGYGGTKPQNISVLNNQNGGKAHLLSSEPPKLKKRDIQFPTHDFFTQSINYFQSKDIFFLFHDLHRLYLQDINNMHIRAKRDSFYQEIVNRVIEKMWQTRLVADEQFNLTSSQLKSEQKIWLLEEHRDTRENADDDDWLDKILKSIAHFIFHGYEKILAKKAIKLGNAELLHMEKIVASNREVLR